MVYFLVSGRVSRNEAVREIAAKYEIHTLSDRRKPWYPFKDSGKVMPWETLALI